MSLADDLQERERLAGNAEDGTGLGQKSYDEKFNKASKAKGEDESGSSDNPEKIPGGSSVDSHGDTVKRNFNSDDEPDQDKVKSGEENPKSFYKGGGSQAPQRGFAGRLGAGAKKFGPQASVTSMIFLSVFGIGGGTTLLSGSLLINMKEVFHNNSADASRTNRLFSRATISNMFNGADGCKSKVPLKCKISSMSKAMVSSFEKQKFKIKGLIIGSDGKPTGESLGGGADDIKAVGDTDRVQLSEIDFPDGQTIAKNGKQLDSEISKSPGRLSEMMSAFNTKSSFYLNKFFDNFLEKFKFSKKAKAFPAPEENSNTDKNHPTPNSKEGSTANQDKEFNTEVDPLNKNTDGVINANETEGLEKVTNDTESGISKYTKSASAVATAIHLACTAYQASYMAQAAIKAYHLTQLAKFALMFFQAADEIKDGRGDSNRTTYLANNLVATDKHPKLADGKANPKYGLSATDSEGYKIATDGDKAGLKSFSKKFLIGGDSTVLNTVTSISAGVGAAVGKVPGLSGNTDHAKVKSLCRTASGSGLIGSGIQCGSAAIALQGVATAAIPAIGNVFAAGVGAVLCSCAFSISNSMPQCIALNKGTELLGGWLIKELTTSSLVKDAVAKILKSFNVDSGLKGVDAGNAIAAGAGLMLPDAATGYGLRPASSANNNQEVKNYIAYTQPIENQYIAAQKYDASKNPFDASNQYSIMGAVVKSLNPTNLSAANSGLFGLLSTTTGIFSTSLNILSGAKTANADYSQPISPTDVSDNCEDADLNELGMACDAYGGIVAISSIPDMQNAQQQINNPNSQNIDDLADWMMNPQPDTKCDVNYAFDSTSSNSCLTSDQFSIGPDGTPNKASQYQMYLDNCTDDRSAYWGTQFQSYYEGSARDQAWFSGEECMADVSNGTPGYGPNTPQGIMVHNFRMWTNYCLQIGTMDGAANCYTPPTSDSGSGNSTCGDGTTASIYQCALQFDPYGYASPGSDHGDNVLGWYQNFQSNPPAAGTPLLDCSGLVMASIAAAFGQNIPNMTAPADFENPKFWQKVPDDQAKQGDVVVFSIPDGHVEIIKDNDTNGQTFTTFGAHTANIAIDQQISETHYSYASVNEGTWHYIGPGVKQ